MRLVKPHAEIWAAFGHPELPYTYEDAYGLIEAAGRVCYKSEDKIWQGGCPGCGGQLDLVPADPDCQTCGGGQWTRSAEQFVDMLSRRGHHAMLEHSWFVKLVPSYLPRSFGRPDPSPHLRRAPDTEYVAGNLRAFSEWFPSALARSEVELGPEDYKQWPMLYALTAHIVCDRGVTHEIVRHRPVSYAQESSRYCDYHGSRFGGHVAFVIPPWLRLGAREIDKKDWGGIKTSFIDPTTEAGQIELAATQFWLDAMWKAEAKYQSLRELGWRPEQARAVLPNSLKTEIVVTAGLDEWQHIFRLRCAPAAHPQMREIMIPLRDRAKKLYPGVFDDPPK